MKPVLERYSRVLSGKSSGGKTLPWLERYLVHPGRDVLLGVLPRSRWRLTAARPAFVAGPLEMGASGYTPPGARSSGVDQAGAPKRAVRMDSRRSSGGRASNRLSELAVGTTGSMYAVLERRRYERSRDRPTAAPGTDYRAAVVAMAGGMQVPAPSRVGFMPRSATSGAIAVRAAISGKSAALRMPVSWEIPRRSMLGAAPPPAFPVNPGRAFSAATGVLAERADAMPGRIDWVRRASGRASVSPGQGISAAARSAGIGVSPSTINALVGIPADTGFGRDGTALSGREIVPRGFGHGTAYGSGPGAGEGISRGPLPYPDHASASATAGQGLLPSGAPAAFSSQPATMIALHGEVVLDGRKLGHIVAAGQTSGARLPAASGSSINLRTMPVFTGTSVAL